METEIKRDLARTYTTAAIKTLAEIASNPNSSDNSRVATCNAILDRGFGKPMQHQQNVNVNVGVNYLDYSEMLAEQETEEIKVVNYSVDNLQLSLSVSPKPPTKDQFVIISLIHHSHIRFNQVANMRCCICLFQTRRGIIQNKRSLTF